MAISAPDTAPQVSPKRAITTPKGAAIFMAVFRSRFSFSAYMENTAWEQRAPSLNLDTVFSTLPSEKSGERQDVHRFPNFGGNSKGSNSSFAGY